MSDDDSASPAAVLRSLVARAVDADPADLDGRVEVVERGSESEGGDAAGSDASAPARRLAELVGEAGSVVAVVPRLDADLARRLNESLAAGGDGADGERDADPEADVSRAVRVVFTGAASDRLAGATGSVVRRALADRGVDAYRHEGESPVAVALGDDRAVVGLIDGAGVAALLWTDDPAVREWAAATCRRYLDAAEQVTGD
ncbi:hypothetical protein C463_11302 [Halorubrum californiense DSM 19288]|uniref:Methanogenesis regulatory protein FilR1 middle domain-containing protein n=1 Tax=Halorubrum californiense DSM 19288 TaxID=1227465 RepID=M0E718_9EURY|nr:MULTISPECIES: hypothetical protein [Halorubrum]ELZ42159.1 hypothetical protein C463_11302 [Halorubrum californiense DSM 19288]TKX70905.1 hypothetical protein EXE40_08370 [Halorubrum sp. GN11GM_10-3_MGM]